MTNIVKFGSANLPTAASLSAALRRTSEDPTSMTSSILKMDKTGHWVYSADLIEIDRSGIWAVNPLSFTHGFIAWGEGVVLGEHVVSITDPLPELGPAPSNAERGWEKQLGMSLKCLSGEDKDVQARFATTAVGGIKAMRALTLRVADEVDKNPDNCVPLVKLGVDHYPHKKYGRVFTPVFEITGWTSLNGPVEDQEDEGVVEADTGRRRRS